MPISYKLHLWLWNLWINSVKWHLASWNACFYARDECCQISILSHVEDEETGERECTYSKWFWILRILSNNDFHYRRGVSRYSIERASCYSEYRLSYRWECVLFTQLSLLYFIYWRLNWSCVAMCSFHWSEGQAQPVKNKLRIARWIPFLNIIEYCNYIINLPLNARSIYSRFPFPRTIGFVYSY